MTRRAVKMRPGEGRNNESEREKEGDSGLQGERHGERGLQGEREREGEGKW